MENTWVWQKEGTAKTASVYLLAHPGNLLRYKI